MLGIPPDSSRRQVVAAFKKAALAHHPDKNAVGDRDDATARFREAKTAYDVLMADFDRPWQRTSKTTDPKSSYSSASNASAAPPRRGPMGPPRPPAPEPPSSKVRAAAFASFRPSTSTTQDKSSEQQQQQQPSPTNPVNRPTSAQSSRSTTSTSSRSTPRSGSDHSSSSSTQPIWRTHANLWGQPCGGCRECRREAAVPSETVRLSSSSSSIFLSVPWQVLTHVLFRTKCTARSVHPSIGSPPTLAYTNPSCTCTLSSNYVYANTRR